MSILLDIDASSRQSLDLPAEGLLGAARLAPLGPPSGFALRRSTWAAPKLSNPTFLMSGVRIETMARWKANRGSCTVVRGLPAEGLLGADAPRPCGAAVEDAGVQLRLAAKLSNPLVVCRGFEWTTSSGGNLARFSEIFVGVCRLRDSNPRPTVYKTVALPLC